MKRGSLLVLRLALLLGPVCTLLAQETTDSENMRFVNALRQRGDNDLARAFLEKMRQSASPALALELPLEIAKTRLAEAAGESDNAKKTAMLNEARQEFELFLQRNPNHPRAGEARLEIVQVAVQQGKVLLSKALSAEGPEARRTEGVRARAALEEAGKRLGIVAKEIQAALRNLSEPKTPMETAQRRKLEDDYLAAELAVGLNLFDQGLSFPRDDRSDQVMRLRGAKIVEAQKVLDKLALRDSSSPYVWQAKAWAARCLHENGDPKGARGRYTEIMTVAEKNPAAVEAQRLLRYFRLLAIEESEDRDKIKEIEEGCYRWLKDYPRSKNTPEGYGIQYLLVEVHLGRAGDKKTLPRAKEIDLSKARALLRELETTENEFSERARRKKLAVINEQGGFTKKIDQLNSFEDCFIRSQFEISQIPEDMKNAKSPDAGEKARLKRIDNVTAALKRGLSMPDAKGKRSPEIGAARAMLAYYALGTKHYADAIKLGEGYATEDAVAPQAANAASYALQAYAQMIAEHEDRLEKSAGDLLDDAGRKVDPAAFAANLKTERERMVKFARYVEKTWPRDNAADLARHQLGILLLREKGNAEQRAKNMSEAIQSLSGVTPAYPGFAYARFLLAVKAMEAEKEKLPPLEEPGKPLLSWRQRALAALESIPEPITLDPGPSEMYVKARCILGNEMFKEKKFDQMEQLARPLLETLPKIRLSDDDAKDKQLHEDFQKQLMFIRLFGQYGRADAAFTANDFAKTSAILDPLVDEIKANKDHPLKTNLPLSQALMSMAMRTYIQTGRIDRARAGIAALKHLGGEEGDANATILRQLLALINRQLEELRQKGDKEKLKQAIDGFSALLLDLGKTTLTPQVILNLAQCYSSMDQHAKAIELLNQYPKPKPDDQAALPQFRGKQLALIRETRLNAASKPETERLAEMAKIKPLLDEIMGTKVKPEWGAKNIDALKELVAFLIEDGKFSEAYSKSSGVVKALKDKVEDNTMKAHYLDFYYQMVLAMYKHAQKSTNQSRKDRTTAEAARFIDQLEKRFKDFGNETTALRFQELLKNEPELKAAYDKLRTAGN